MSAQALGRQLLDGSTEESLDELLRSLRAQQTKATKNHTGFTPIDHLLRLFEKNDSRQDRDPHAASVKYGERSSDLPPVLEITGISACSGKSELVMHIIARKLLPHSAFGLRISGLGQAVVLLDLSNRISILRLADLMRACMLTEARHAGIRIDGQQVNSIVESSLSHLHIFHPSSTASLIATLESLPSYLLAIPSSHFSLDRSIGLIAISDAGAFLAQDRLDSETEADREYMAAADSTNDGDTSTKTELERGNTRRSNGGAKDSLSTQRHRRIVQILSAVRTEFSSPIILTTHATASPVTLAKISSAGKTAKHGGVSSTITTLPASLPDTTPPRLPLLRPPLPLAYTSLRTLHLLCARDATTKFATGMSAEEAWAEREQRWAVVSRRRFSCWVNWWESARWSEEVRAILLRRRDQGRERYRDVQVERQRAENADGQENDEDEDDGRQSGCHRLGGGFGFGVYGVDGPARSSHNVDDGLRSGHTTGPGVMEKDSHRIDDGDAEADDDNEEGGLPRRHVSIGKGNSRNSHSSMGVVVLPD